MYHNNATMSSNLTDMAQIAPPRSRGRWPRSGRRGPAHDRPGEDHRDVDDAYVGRAGHEELQPLGAFAFHLERDLLDVEHDVGDPTILSLSKDTHAGQARERAAWSRCRSR